MSSSWISAFEKRAKEVRTRAVVRAWEYRQRDYAKGVWFRLRRTLTDASAAFAISESLANQLIAAGFSPLPVGRQLHPERTIFLLGRNQLENLHDLREVPLHLGPILHEPYLILLSMDEEVQKP